MIHIVNNGDYLTLFNESQFMYKLGRDAVKTPTNAYCGVAVNNVDEVVWPSAAPTRFGVCLACLENPDFQLAILAEA